MPPGFFTDSNRGRGTRKIPPSKEGGYSDGGYSEGGNTSFALKVGCRRLLVSPEARMGDSSDKNKWVKRRKTGG